MGTHTASCGHEIEGIESGHMINNKDHDREGKRVFVSQIVCDKCFKWYKRKKLILSNEQEAQDWLEGK